MKTNKKRLMDLAGIKKPLNEGYAWERDENGALPTLASSTAKHAANQQDSVQETANLKEVTNEVALSNEILNFLEERGVITGENAQKVHKDLTALLKDKLL